MHLRRARMLIASAVVVVAAAGCAHAPTSRSSTPAAMVSAVPSGSAAPTTAPVVPAGVSWPETGALFGGPPGDLGDHYCSSAVVDSPAGDVVMTAAHCVADGDGTPARTGMSFVPGYHDHQQPFGVFTVTASYVDDEWRDHGDPDHDVAFLTVSRAGAPPVEQLTGGYRLTVGTGPDITAGAAPVDAIGYPDFADAPQKRSGTLRAYSPTQLELPAHGLYNGTSGGPWLLTSGPDGVDVDVVGVTGGYEQGGFDPETSYAAMLGAAADALFHAAQAP